jgi:hypothetical protein
MNQPTKHNTENSRKEYSPNKFLPVRRNRIALQNATLKKDTSRYREEMQTKFKYLVETTANAAKIPRQMSLFIKQDQITSNLRNDSKQRQHKENTTHLYPEKETQGKFRTIKSNYCNFQTNSTKTASAQNVEKLYKNANLTKILES